MKVAALFFLVTLLAPALAGPAIAELLSPYKDKLFSYPARLGESDKGRHIIIDYRAERDINGRDEMPERRVRSNYVDLRVRRIQQDLIGTTIAGPVRHIATGYLDDARFIVVYLHGQGGNRRQGMDDFTFGGNFNRIKNLASRNHGLYLTADFRDFAAEGTRQIASLIDIYAARSPKAAVFLACGSMGGSLCWWLANNAAVAPHLGGLILLGSHWDDGFFASHAFRRKVPVFFGHGSNDRVYPIVRQEAFFRKILQRSPDYPARFVRFETGSHGTPIRMSDWRSILNWMTEQQATR